MDALLALKAQEYLLVIGLTGLAFRDFRWALALVVVATILDHWTA
jgi:hypothetical protein